MNRPHRAGRARGTLLFRADRSRSVVLATALLSAIVLLLRSVPASRIGPWGEVLSAAAGLFVLPLAVRLWRRRTRHGDLVLGPATLAVVHTVIGVSGGPESSPAYPLIYVWVAFAAGLLSPLALMGSGALAAIVEVGVHVTGGEGALGLATLLAHIGFMALFAALFASLLSSEVRSVRRTGEDVLRDALARVEEDARDFRLIGSSLGAHRAGIGEENKVAFEPFPERNPEESARVRQVGSVRAIRESLLDVLEVAKLGVGADAAMLFILNEAGTKLKLKECIATEGDRSIIERTITATEGALGAVVKTQRSVNLRPREGGRGLGYRTRADIGSFLGVPVIDAGHLSGVLAVDRPSDVAFTESDEELLTAVAREAQRAIESERIFIAMDRVKYEQERLYDAFSLLNEALSIDVFADRLLEAVGRIKSFDFSCVTLYDDERSAHSIVSVRSTANGVADALRGATFLNKDGGLVSMALKNGHPLPYVPLSEQPDRSKLQLFGRLTQPALESVKVFPLSTAARPAHASPDGSAPATAAEAPSPANDRPCGEPLGALVVGSGHRGFELSREEERMIEIVSAHAAVTLANARMYRRMEMMATTDGLTGLVNHRRFKALLGEAIARATRFNRNVSILMIDADHFKTINDTYGHPVGDRVLWRIARILELEARRTDVVARYGGEEFVVILDETDTPGAAMVAERVRERIESDVIQGDFGRVRVTASLGLATWPEHAEAMEDLLERADQALYEAKKKGRNRVAIARGPHCASPDRPAIGHGDRAIESSPPQVRN